MKTPVGSKDAAIVLTSKGQGHFPRQEHRAMEAAAHLKAAEGSLLESARQGASVGAAAQAESNASSSANATQAKALVNFTNQVKVMSNATQVKALDASASSAEMKMTAAQEFDLHSSATTPEVASHGAPRASASVNSSSNATVSVANVSANQKDQPIVDPMMAGAVAVWASSVGLKSLAGRVSRYAYGLLEAADANAKYIEVGGPAVVAAMEATALSLAQESSVSTRHERHHARADLNASAAQAVHSNRSDFNETRQQAKVGKLTGDPILRSVNDFLQTAGAEH